MKKTFNNLLLSILAGIVISLGCLVFLLIPNNIIGAIFFTTGLFLVLTRGYNLFTGKVAYAIDNKISYTFQLLITWIGNLIGSLLMVFAIKNTHLYNKISERIANITDTKITQGYLSALILAILCGIIIFLAVENYKNNPHEIGKYLGLLFLIPLFIICNFEHCIADMFYFFINTENFLIKLTYIITITIGNSVGSIIANAIKKYKNKGDKG